MKNKIFSFELKSNVLSGKLSIFKLQEYFKKNNIYKCLFIFDKNLVQKSKYIKKFLGIYKKNRNIRIVFFEGKKEPTYQMVDETYNNLKKINKIDCVVACGGGSAIDFAKALAVVIKNKKPSLNFKGFHKKEIRSIPIVAIPSTVSSGAELAFNAPLIDEETGMKFGINVKSNTPSLSVLDPMVVFNSSKKLVITSSLSALFRCVDTMFNSHSTTISKLFSKLSFKLLYENILIYQKNKNNLEAISKLQWGAYFSIASLLNSSSGIQGSIAYYFASKGVPQGLTHAIAGMKCLEMNFNKGFYDFAELYEEISFKNKTKQLNSKQKSKLLILSLKKLFKINQINLKKFNLKKNVNEILDFFPKVYSKNYLNNPINVGKSDLIKLINSIA